MGMELIAEIRRELMDQLSRGEDGSGNPGENR